MPAQNSTQQSLRPRLLDGFTYKSRSDNSVHTVKGADGKVIAEVCEGKKATRLNLRNAPTKATPKNVTLGGKSKTWAGGGTVVTESSLAACRALLSGAAKVTPTASDAARVSAKATAEADTARKQVARVGRRSGVKVTA